MAVLGGPATGDQGDTLPFADKPPAKAGIIPTRRLILPGRWPDGERLADIDEVVRAAFA